MKHTLVRNARVGLLPIAVVALLLVIGTSGGAVAGALITGKQIKDNTVTTRDIRNNTLTLADLAPAARAALGDTGVSGAVAANGTLTLYHAPAGARVTVAAGEPGAFCVTVQGGPRVLRPGTATLVAAPDYRTDSTSASSDRTAHVESATGTSPTCPSGFTVVTLVRAGAALDLDPEPFVFQID